MPVLIVNQEMVVRLGAVTGVGHARLINERFGKFWGAFSVGDLFLLNFLTIVTEFIGVSLALGYFGVSEYISVPVAADSLVAMTATGSFRRWERFMFVFIFGELPGDPAGHLQPPAGRPLSSTVWSCPGCSGGFDSTSVLLVIAIVGHHGGPVAALLPAVQHHRQADHAQAISITSGSTRCWALSWSPCWRLPC